LAPDKERRPPIRAIDHFEANKQRSPNSWTRLAEDYGAAAAMRRIQPSRSNNVKE